MNDAEILERAKRPVKGDRFEWKGQVCEVLDITSVRNVGDVVHYTFTAYGKTDSLSEFVKNWPERVEKTIHGGAVFVPSNTQGQPRREKE